MTLESISASYEDPRFNGGFFAKGDPPPNGVDHGEGGAEEGDDPPPVGDPPPNGKGDPPPNGKN